MQHLGVQASYLQAEVNRVDSLVYFSEFEAAKSHILRLENWLEDKNIKADDRVAELKLLLHKSYVLTREASYAEALESAFKVIDKSIAYQLPEQQYHAYLLAASIYEISRELSTCKIYLDKARDLLNGHALAHVFAVYCVRVASYFRFVNEKDSALYYSYKALDSAIKYGNRRELIDAPILLGILLSSTDYRQSTTYYGMAANAFMQKNDRVGAAAMYQNISGVFLRNNNLREALLYSDSALLVLGENTAEYSWVLQQRHNVFEALGKQDSAFYYFKKYHYAHVAHLQKMERLEVNRITSLYQSQKQEAAISSKNRQIFLIVILLIIIVIAIILIVRKNRKISAQNIVISKQVEELMRSLDQKQMLLSELQHRVKNNLQHVISILEIQKESVDFNNIDELIRGNQNRIHSMALLHKKLNVADNANEVDLRKYVTELSELVKESYDTSKKSVSLIVSCEVDKISIEKALPLGLIIVELVSNSMKHAFKMQQIGVIQIALTINQLTGAKKLYYADNGIGFDFHAAGHIGLGMEIIKGLIGQLDANAESSRDNGFELTLNFN